MSSGDKHIVDRGWEAMVQRLDQEMPVKKRRRRALWFWLGGLGSILMLATLVFFIFGESPSEAALSEASMTENYSREVQEEATHQEPLNLELEEESIAVQQQPEKVTERVPLVKEVQEPTKQAFIPRSTQVQSTQIILNKQNIVKTKYQKSSQQSKSTNKEVTTVSPNEIIAQETSNEERKEDINVNSLNRLALSGFENIVMLPTLDPVSVRETFFKPFIGIGMSISDQYLYSPLMIAGVLSQSKSKSNFGVLSRFQIEVSSGRSGGRNDQSILAEGGSEVANSDELETNNPSSEYSGLFDFFNSGEKVSDSARAFSLQLDPFYRYQFATRLGVQAGPSIGIGTGSQNKKVNFGLHSGLIINVSPTISIQGLYRYQLSNKASTITLATAYHFE